MHVTTDDVIVVGIAISVTNGHFHGSKSKAVVKRHKAP
jgi:hypothetical protein